MDSGYQPNHFSLLLFHVCVLLLYSEQELYELFLIFLGYSGLDVVDLDFWGSLTEAHG